MDDYQKYPLKGVFEQSDIEQIVEALADAGYYQCEFDINSNEVIIPIEYADFIDDIEEVLLDLGYEMDDR